MHTKVVFVSLSVVFLQKGTNRRCFHSHMYKQTLSHLKQEPTNVVSFQIRTNVVSLQKEHINLILHQTGTQKCWLHAEGFIQLLSTTRTHKPCLTLTLSHFKQEYTNAVSFKQVYTRVVCLGTNKSVSKTLRLKRFGFTALRVKSRWRSSVCPVHYGLKCLQADSEVFDQTAWMCRLIGAFADSTFYKVRFPLIARPNRL